MLSLVSEDSNFLMETVIEIRPYRGGWQCFEAPAVQPYYTGPNARDYAISYAKARTLCGGERFGSSTQQANPSRLFPSITRGTGYENVMDFRSRASVKLLLSHAPPEALI
jgi:hypothetical protein